MAISLAAPEKIDFDIELPGSKSITNRALIIAALSGNYCSITNASFSDDSKVLYEALGRFGVSIIADKSSAVSNNWPPVKNPPEMAHGAMVVAPKAPPPTALVSVTSHLLMPCIMAAPWAPLILKSVAGTGTSNSYLLNQRPFKQSSDNGTFFLGNSGTALRFFVPYLSLHSGEFIVDGDQRMRERPVAPLLDSLNQLGSRTSSIFSNGNPPVKVNANGLNGGVVNLDVSLSSQYLSGLLLCAPYAKSKVEILVSSITSKSYVDMTLNIMKEFRGKVVIDNKHYMIEPHQYKSKDFFVESDAAAANYFFGIAAALKGRVKVTGLGKKSIQPERSFVYVLKQMGCKLIETDNSTEIVGSNLKGLEIDMNDMPDSVPTLACLALLAEDKTVIRNVANLRIKETDRLDALANELTRLGARVTQHNDGLEITPPRVLSPCQLQTYNDHRMAMSLSIPALCDSRIAIENPSCVSKSFPDFFQRLQEMGVKVNEIRD